MRTRTRVTEMAPCDRAASPIWSNIACTRLYSCMVSSRPGVAGMKPRGSLLEERGNALDDFGSIGRARQFLQLAIEMRVELIEAGRLIEQLFGDRERMTRS